MNQQQRKYLRVRLDGMRADKRKAYAAKVLLPKDLSQEKWTTLGRAPKRIIPTVTYAREGVINGDLQVDHALFKEEVVGRGQYNYTIQVSNCLRALTPAAKKSYKEFKKALVLETTQRDNLDAYSAKLDAEYTKVMDEIMLGDNETALKLLEAFSKL